MLFLYLRFNTKEKEMLNSAKSALVVLAEKSSMIKRPIIEFPNGDLVLGFEPEEIKGKL